jgi:hypothetical protein
VQHTDAGLPGLGDGRQSERGADVQAAVARVKFEGTGGRSQGPSLPKADEVHWWSMKAEIDRFLQSGDHDPLMASWPGRSAVERMRAGWEVLTTALIEEVRFRAGRVDTPVPGTIANGDLAAFARKKFAPMVRGLFPRIEHQPVLAVLEQSVVFLTPGSIEGLIRGEGFLSTAWQLANIYLAGIGAETFDDQMRGVVGMSEGTTCYISLEYFGVQDELSDYVVHEAAHVFHNTKRLTIGLAETRKREWLLPIEYRKRETFAYACEAYSRILEIAKKPADRRALAATLNEQPLPSDDRVDADEYVAILTEAVNRRNGWKSILARCSE